MNTNSTVVLINQLTHLHALQVLSMGDPDSLAVILRKQAALMRSLFAALPGEIDAMEDWADVLSLTEAQS